MIRQNDFKDPSTLQGVYQGDLKYGRCLVNEVVRGKDYSSGGTDDSGKPMNKPVFALQPAFKRDQTFWRGRNKHPKIKNNQSNLLDDILFAAVKNPFGLASQLSRVRVGNQDY